MKKLAIIGGGAAGVFAALVAKSLDPSLHVTVYERTRHLLSKVKISGGGRCNVTHSCFDPKKLVQNYPRGEKELLGPFHKFQPTDMIQWLEERGVDLKTEEDGRMFPTTDNSQTIIDCFLNEADRLGVTFSLGKKIDSIGGDDQGFILGDERADIILLATGGHPDGHKLAAALGHTIIPPVPSLFTFNVPSSPLLDLSGISLENVEGSIEGFPLKLRGPLLLTHWGFSGPMILKLSAFAARFLHDCQYQAKIVINWLTLDLITQKNNHPKKFLSSVIPLPKNLLKRLLEIWEFDDQPLSSFKNDRLKKLSHHLSHDTYLMEGKTTYKQEFVTSGGISLKEVDLRRMESRLVPNLFFAGEVLNIDGVTGGFNFQNAWTSAYLAAQALTNSL